ncbi:MAG: matrixin family metalloprotease [Bacteroidales bacterium]|nr:matrixin family metalloprotease [Bacteroidales bacterium]
MNRCRPYRLVHPLRGCGDTRGNAIGYRYISPDGDGWSYGISATYSLAQSPSDHSSLITAHWFYTFSAKERDVETGLSYFGSRYYSSDLSIWLSVDPQSEKYASLSPYNYCANNPVKLVDPNGEEVWISSSINENGEKTYSIHITAFLVNHSVENLSYEDMEKYKAEIIDGLKKTYEGVLDDNTKVHVSADIVIKQKDEFVNPLTTRHIINIVDKLEDIKHAAESTIGGGEMNLLLDVCKGYYPQNPLDRSAAHEFGHLLGLDHVEDDDNIMNPNSCGRVITESQLSEALKKYQNGQINNIISIQHRNELRRQALSSHR